MSNDRDRHMRNLIVRLNMLTEVPAAAAAPEGGASTDEHPSRILAKGGGMDGADWWRLYREARDPEKIIDQAERELADAIRGPEERPAGETPAQEMDRKTARVLHLHNDGAWTRVDIASDTGLTIGQVSKIIMGAAINQRLDAKDRKDAATVIALWNEDRTRTVMYIAARTGYTRQHVRRILHKAA
jgi:hypothetical protein